MKETSQILFPPASCLLPPALFLQSTAKHPDADKLYKLIQKNNDLTIT